MIDQSVLGSSSLYVTHEPSEGVFYTHSGGPSGVSYDDVKLWPVHDLFLKRQTMTLEDWWTANRALSEGKPTTIMLGRYMGM